MLKQMNPGLYALIERALGPSYADLLDLEVAKVWPHEKRAALSFFCAQALPEEMIAKLKSSLQERLTGYEQIEITLHVQAAKPEVVESPPSMPEPAQPNEPVYEFVKVSHSNG